jgi:hypothetical protein
MHTPTDESAWSEWCTTGCTRSWSWCHYMENSNHNLRPPVDSTVDRALTVLATIPASAIPAQTPWASPSSSSSLCSWVVWHVGCRAGGEMTGGADNNERWWWKKVESVSNTEDCSTVETTRERKCERVRERLVWFGGEEGRTTKPTNPPTLHNTPPWTLKPCA